MSEEAFKSWEIFFNPDTLKSNLIQSSIYLASYEIFKNGTIDKLKDFFTSRWHMNENTGELEGIPSESYKEKVLNLYPKDEFHACCLWFKNLSALTDDDMMDIAIIRKHRNTIAHELPKFITGQGLSVSLKNLNSLISIQDKLDKWWIKEIEIPTNPDYDADSYEDIDWNNVIGGNTILLSLLSTIFDGNDAYLKGLHKIFVDKWNKTA